MSSLYRVEKAVLMREPVKATFGQGAECSGGGCIIPNGCQATVKLPLSQVEKTFLQERKS